MIDETDGYLCPFSPDNAADTASMLLVVLPLWPSASRQLRIEYACSIWAG